MAVTDLVRRPWRLAWRAGAYVKRRAREAGPLWRGKMILRRYTAHYARARRAYNGRAVAAPSTRVYDVGVRVSGPGAADSFLALPADFATRTARVASAADAALARSAHCDFFPAVSAASITERTADVPEVVDGQVITIKLRDPFAVDGIGELCEPLLAQLERAVYGCHLIVDKVYVYRSPISRQQPKASWLWHFDNHPREMLKVMVYLTDVDEDSAPFEYLRDPAGVPRLGAPLAPLHGDSRIPAAQIERHLDEGWSRHIVTGPAGTVLVFDDNVVHRGTLARRRHRDVVVFQVRPAAFRATPYLDTRWTGTFGHRDFNRDPDDMRPTLRPPKR
jgi:hypothetical protein